MRKHDNLRAGFTLIELLVVISIIAVLMAMLLPALGGARKLARRAVCMANVRRLAVSIRLYADNYDGKLPPDRLRKPTDYIEVGPYKRASVVLQQGVNNVLIKVAARDSKNIFFQLGGPDDLAADEFNNDLWELVDGYAEFIARSRNEFDPTATSRLVTLSYTSAAANSVAVIGSFNGWSPVDTSMRRSQNGQWEISLHLPPGRYAYRFLINNDEQVLDPLCSIKEPDGYGGMNSVLFVR